MDYICTKECKLHLGAPCTAHIINKDKTSSGKLGLICKISTIQASPIKFKRTYSNNAYEKKKGKLFEKEAHKNYYLRVKKIYR